MRRFLFVAFLVAACSGSTPEPTQAPSVPAPSPARASMPVIAISTALACASPGVSPHQFPHQAPEIEARLPARVAGRAMTRWSVRGECWLELTVAGPAYIPTLLAQFTTAANPHPNDPAQLVYGVDGRSNTKTDPPYFVYAALRPRNDDELRLAVLLLLGGARFYDPDAGADLSKYQEQTVGGKHVHVGTIGMLEQDDHQRGKPYLYETDEWLFLVITDDAAWAENAIGQLP